MKDELYVMTPASFLEGGDAMPGKAAKIHLSEKQLVILTKISQSRSVPQFMSQRAKIICLAFEGQWNESIAGVVGLERHQVGLWRRR